MVFIQSQVAGPTAEALFDIPDPFLKGVRSFTVPITISSECIYLSRPEDMNISAILVECKTEPRAIENSGTVYSGKFRGLFSIP